METRDGKEDDRDETFTRARSLAKLDDLLKDIQRKRLDGADSS
jgi:hypothetical protein